MILTTAAELIQAQEAQLAAGMREWPADTLEIVMKRIAAARAEFKGDLFEAVPVYDLERFFPRGTKIEVWVAERHAHVAYQAADDAWSAELGRVFGRGAGDARYAAKGKSTPRLAELHDAREAARLAYDKAQGRA
jgi:hypothetical protein